MTVNLYARHEILFTPRGRKLGEPLLRDMIWTRLSKIVQVNFVEYPFHALQ